MSDISYEKQLEAFGVESVKMTESDVERARQAERKKSYLNVVRHIMETMDGRQYLYHKLELCQTFSTPFVPHQPDVSNFNAGAQAFGMSLFNEMMSAAPNECFLMLQEAEARSRPAATD